MSASPDAQFPAPFDGNTMGRLKKIGIERPSDLLFLPPIRYCDYRHPDPGFAAAYQSGQSGYFKVRATSSARVQEKGQGGAGKPAMAFLNVTDGVDEASISVFGAVFPWRSVRSGQFIHVAGKVDIWNGRYSLKSPELIGPDMQGRIVPVYPGKKRVIRPESVARFVSIALELFMGEAREQTLSRLGMDELSLMGRIGSHFGSLERLFRSLHYPERPEDVPAALDDIRKLSALEKVINRERANAPGGGGGVSDAGIAIDDARLRQLAAEIPFPLTEDQRRCIWDICKDMRATSPMDRVLTGDVGSGKTVVYGMPAAAAHLAGHQVVVMMPNTLLAEQVREEIAETFPSVSTLLMVSGHEQSGPVEGNPIIVGTSAILHWMDSLNAPMHVDLLIVDEQQKFSAEQRALINGSAANRLEASATPIPRTAALMRYGSKRISRISQMPVEKDIRSALIAPGQGRNVMAAIDRALAAGDQAAVLYPTRRGDVGEHRVAIARLAIGENDPIEVMRSFRVRRCEADDDAVPADVCAARGAQDAAVYSYVLSSERNDALIDRLGEVFGDGNVAYLGANDRFLDKRNALVARDLFEKRYPGRVALLHGGLTNEEKTGAIRAVREGRYDIVVTTSVVEIGITIPRLRVVHVTDATVYGANTLHQIRGRLARKGGSGLFFMGIPRPFDRLADNTKRRLKMLLNTTDGFEIAEQELRDRGFGDLSREGEMQSGYHDGLFSRVRVTADDIEDVLG